VLVFEPATWERQIATARIRSSLSRELIDEALFWLLIAGLAWCPFWLGSHDLFAWGTNGMLFPGLTALYEVTLLARGERHSVAVTQIGTPAALFAAVVIWIVVQNCTSIPAGMQNPIWHVAGLTLEADVPGSISVNRDLTTLALLRLLTAASVFWLSLQLCRDIRRAYQLLNAGALIGAAYALYGLLAFGLTPGYVLWLPTLFSKGYVTSTFINHNSFATYAGMDLIVVCGLIVRLYRHEVAHEGGPASFKIAFFIEVTGRQGAMFLAIGFLLASALLLSGSRAGMLASVLGLLVFGSLSVQRHRSTLKHRRASIVFVAVLIATAFLVLGVTVLGRMAGQGIGEESRMAAYRSIISAIRNSPLSGFGYGTFADVFPLYRDRSVGVDGNWTMAPNAYLEVFEDLGLIFGALLIASIVLLAYQIMKRAIARQRGAATQPSDATILCVVTGIAFLVGIHSYLDSRVLNQALTLTFAALLGAGAAQSVSYSQIGDSRGARFIAIVILAVCGWALIKASEIVAFRIAQARAIDRPEATATWASVRGLAAYALEPVVSLPIDPVNQQTVATRLNQLSALLSARPLDSMHWLSLAATRHLAGEVAQKVRSALRLSFLTGPNEGGVLLQRVLFGLSVWDELPADIQWRVAKDLTMPGFSDAEKAKIRTVLSTQPESVRIALRDLLREQGTVSGESLLNMGL
jgi:hypothetical protein